MKKLFRISTVPLSLNILLKDQLRFLDQFYEVTAISGSGKDMEEVRVREGVKIKEIEISREISIFKDIVSLVQLYRYFKKEKPNIIHSITPKAGLLSMIAGKLAGVPVRMHTFTGLIFPSKKGILKVILILMDQLLASSATHIYPEGIGVREDLKKYRITTKPLKIIANGNVNGIDTQFFNRREFSEVEQIHLKLKLGIQSEEFVFIFVGRLVRDKGINELVAAFKNLKLQGSGQLDEKIKTSKLLLVGPLESDLDPLEENTLAEIKSDPDIISVGFQSDVRAYFALSNVLTFPSYREGFPNVVLQSLALEIPVIATNINGCNEIVKAGYNGLIVPVKDVNTLQNAMYQMISDDLLYETLHSNAQQSILPFEQKIVWEALLAEYRKLEGF